MRKPRRFISSFATFRAELRGRNIQYGVPARRTGVAYRRRTGAAYRRAYGRVREPYKSDGLRCPIIHPKSQNHRKPSETIGNHRKQKYGRNNHRHQKPYSPREKDQRKKEEKKKGGERKDLG